MKTAIVILVGAVLTFSGVWSNPAYCEWDEVEVAVTFVFSGIFEGQDLVLENVYRSLTGPFTYPSEMEMIESIPEIPWVDHLAYNSTFGTYSLFYSSPDDFGGYALIDRRSGHIAFVGGSEWWGGAKIIFPLSSNTSWAELSEEEPILPAESYLIENPIWPGYCESEAEIGERLTGFVLNTDICHQLGACGRYSMYVFCYRNNGQWFDGKERGIVIISGPCGQPWQDEITETRPSTLGMIKSFFQGER